MNSNQDIINFEKLEKELNVAIEADAKYDRENAAKFRAVNQRVGSYEEFRDIVLASHLKPLERKDIIAVDHKIGQKWNSIYDGQKQSDEENIPDTVEENTLSMPVDKITCRATTNPRHDIFQPENADSFLKYWKKDCKSDVEKYEYLKFIRNNVLCRIFRHDIPMGILGEATTVMQNCFNGTDCGTLLDVLHAFTASDRFKLSVQFLSKSEKKSLLQLYRFLDDNMNQSVEHMKLFDNIKDKFSIVE